MTKFQKKTIPVSKKLISYLLVFALLVQTFIVAIAVPTNVLAASAEAKVMTSAVDSGIAYITTKNLSYYGDRTYKLSLTATSSIREAHETDIFAASNDGYITADAAGYYLLELYGGAGGDGDSTAQGGEGSGGRGGYAYGYVWLKEGDTLVYTIGADGDSAIYGVEEGSDESGAYAVGLGGGYSAIYLIPAEDGYSGSLTEDYRLNNYIMIAGGGGGGGAGNGALYPSTGNADGGAGGSVAYGAGIPVSAEENGGVAGTYFSGKDGATSGWVDGTSYDYVGKGGSNVPGGESADSWANGGSGGNGSYRGGAGGSGFAGGSGGAMTDILTPSNVGGGGGGSSFIAESVTVFDINSAGNVSELLDGPGNNENGGKAVISYIGADPTTKAYTEHLKNVTIQGTISEYFDILSVSVDNGNAANPQYTTSGNTVTVTGADITPDDLGYEDADNFCRVDIIIKAKTDFFGGNKVPVLAEGTNFTLTTAASDYTEQNKHFDAMTFGFGGEKNGAEYDDSADYCNVSLNMSASANSYAYSLSNIPNPFLNAANLYNDKYTSYRSNMNQTASRYLETISAYSVSPGIVTPTTAGKWFYDVSFTVTPKVKAENAAIVGPVVENSTTFSDTAVIIVLEAGKYVVGNEGVSLSVDKLLSYDSATDQYKLQVSVTGEYEASTIYNKYVYRNSSDFSSSYTVPVSGWYAIGARGGQGGDGHSAGGRYYAVGNYTYADGGFGAFGDAITGYIHLNKGDNVSWYAGNDNAHWCFTGQLANHCSGGSAGDNNKRGVGGVGGEASWIAVNGTPVIVAAGGAGGGGAAVETKAIGSDVGRAGGNAADISHRVTATVNSSYAGSPASYNGNNGANASSVTSPGAAGSKKASYRSTSVSTSISVNGTTYSNPSFPEQYYNKTLCDGSSPSSVNLGAAMISFVAADDTRFSNLELTADFQRYFDLKSVNYNGSGATGYSTSAGGSDGNGTKVTGLKPTSVVTTTTTTSGNTATVKFRLSEIKYEFYLSAKDGFVGGNDVPLLNALSIYVPYYNSTTSVTAKNETDYANVPIKYNFDPENFVTVDGIRINCGDSLQGGIDDILVTDTIPVPAAGSADAWKWEYAKAVTAKDAYTADVAAGTKTPIGGALFETTPYTLTQRIEPRAASTKATVVGSVSPIEVDNHVTVTVVRPVEAVLSNAKIVYNTSVEGVDTEDGDETVKVATEADLSGVIIPDVGYALPEDINVYVCGTQMSRASAPQMRAAAAEAGSGYIYDNVTGAFTIPADAVRALVESEGTHNANELDPGHEHDIVITVDAEVQSFKLTFVWLDADGVEHTEFDDAFLEYIGKSSGEVTLPSTTSGEFDTGTDLTTVDWFNQLAALDHTEVDEDREFKWIWGTADYQALTKMPGSNTTVYGYVTGKTYTVNVHYVEEGKHETDLIDPTQIYGTVGTSTVVESPEISGYFPKNASTTVTISKDSEGNVILDVYIEYVKADGKLLVYHVYGDTNEQIKVDEIEIFSPGSQSVDVENIDHYTPYYEDEEVNGRSVNIDITVDDVRDGKAVYIYYQPDQYTLTFNLNADGATFKPGDKPERSVAYNNSLGYDAEEGKFVQFPQPERKGYTFLGWFTTEQIVEEEEAVIESASVNDYADRGGITLYAHWEAIKYMVIVNYVFLDKDGQVMDSTDKYYPAGAADEDEYPWNYDATYTAEVPTYTGFELDKVEKADGTVENRSIEGTMPAVDVVYTVTYKQLTYKLTIEFDWDDLVDQSAELPELPATKEVELVYNEDYSYTREALEGELAEALADYNAYYGSNSELPITGTMGDEALTITVYYTDSVSFELEWGDLQFTMVVDYDTDVHDYIGNEINPSTEESNLITVKNNGNRELPVAFEYGAETLYSDIRAGFTIDEEETAETTVAGGSSATAALSLTLPEDGYGVYENVLSQGEVSFTSGTVTVTIGEADVENGSDQD